LILVLITRHGAAGGSIATDGRIAGADCICHEKLVLAGAGRLIRRGPLMVLIVIASFVASVEAWPSTNGRYTSVVLILLVLLVASHGILDGRNRAITALIVAAKGHGEKRSGQ
jgi:hypothetical protein